MRVTPLVSNIFICSFKPYKGVSSNIPNKHIDISFESFKPYKGVSSNG